MSQSSDLDREIDRVCDPSFLQARDGPLDRLKDVFSYLVDLALQV